MSDIFISYAREDQPQAKRFAAAFEVRGWSVWWDQHIKPGTPFDTVIERELAEARCVVVLWSKHSVEKHWVRAEAGEALQRGILVPVLLDDVSLPLAYRQIQALKFPRWKGHLFPAEFERLTEAVAATLDVAAPPPPPPNRWMWMVATVVLVVLGALVLTFILGDDTVIRGKDGKEMVLVPAGPFLMGSTKQEADIAYAVMVRRRPELRPTVLEPEQPQHPVTVSAFYIDRYEVTVGEYLTFSREKGLAAPPGVDDATGDDYPVMTVTWDEAKRYCAWADKRLPTEAQWEKAARGTDARRYPWGNDPIDSLRANCCASAKRCCSW